MKYKQIENLHNMECYLIELYTYHFPILNC